MRRLLPEQPLLRPVAALVLLAAAAGAGVVAAHLGRSSANWDGLAGESGARHSFTSWYWLLLEPAENRVVLYGAPPAAGLLAGLLFLIAARRQRRRFGQ